jgi:long-chain acyl-CoA synthetase
MTSNRPWVAHYDPEVPQTLAPYPDETMIDLVQARAREQPDAVALRVEGAVVTYASLLQQAEAFGRALEQRGVQRGDRVALLLPNVPQFVVAELGAWMAGAIVAPMNPTYPGEEIAALLSRAGASIAAVLAPFYDHLKSVQARTPVRDVIVAYVRDALSWPKSLLFRLARERSDGHGTQPRGGDVRMRD